MNDGSDRQLIAELIASAATSSVAGPRDLVTMLIAQGSPSRSDRFNAVATEWLRRWRPKPVIVPLPQCACPAGRCEACN